MAMMHVVIAMLHKRGQSNGASAIEIDRFPNYGVCKALHQMLRVVLNANNFHKHKRIQKNHCIGIC